MEIAASEVTKQKGLSVKAIGIDAAPEIGIKAVADSIITATFFYPTEGYSLVRTALNILEGKPYEKDMRLPVSSAVDRTNADILLMQNEALKEETQKIKLLKSQVDDYWERHSSQTKIFYVVIEIVILLFCVLFMIIRAYRLRKKYQEELMDADYLTPQHKALMKIANKNVKILKRLINQILDFRKYENGKLYINLTEVHIATLFRDWADSFEAIARKRNICTGNGSASSAPPATARSHGNVPICSNSRWRAPMRRNGCFLSPSTGHGNSISWEISTAPSSSLTNPMRSLCM